VLLRIIGPNVIFSPPNFSALLPFCWCSFCGSPTLTPSPLFRVCRHRVNLALQVFCVLLLCVFSGVCFWLPVCFFWQPVRFPKGRSSWFRKCFSAALFVWNCCVPLVSGTPPTFKPGFSSFVFVHHHSPVSFLFSCFLLTPSFGSFKVLSPSPCVPFHLPSAKDTPPFLPSMRLRAGSRDCSLWFSPSCHLHRPPGPPLPALTAPFCSLYSLLCVWFSALSLWPLSPRNRVPLRFACAILSTLYGLYVLVLFFVPRLHGPRFAGVLCPVSTGPSCYLFYRPSPTLIDFPPSPFILVCLPLPCPRIYNESNVTLVLFQCFFPPSP